MSYQEYKQHHKNELRPSQKKYTIFLKILHYYISKLSNKRSWSQNNVINFNKLHWQIFGFTCGTFTNI